MKVVYISHPFGGKAINITLASKWVAWAARQGVAPMAPWVVLGQYFSEEECRTKGLEIDCLHVERCDEVWVCGSKPCGNNIVEDFFYISDGMAVEVLHALKHNVKVVDMRQYLELVDVKPLEKSRPLL